MSPRDQRIHDRINDCGTFLRPYVDAKVRERIRAELSTPPTRGEALAGAGFCFAAGCTVAHAWTPTTPLAGAAGALLMLTHVVWPRALSGRRLDEAVNVCLTEEAQALATAWVHHLSFRLRGIEPVPLTWANEYIREPEAVAILAEVGQVPEPMTEVLRLLDERHQEAERAMQTYLGKRHQSVK